jgi:hypothetical protein
MSQTPRVKSVLICPNGMVAVFDERGCQVPELQGVWEEKKGEILRAIDGETVIEDPHGPWPYRLQQEVIRAVLGDYAVATLRGAIAALERELSEALYALTQAHSSLALSDSQTQDLYLALVERDQARRVAARCYQWATGGYGVGSPSGLVDPVCDLLGVEDWAGLPSWLTGKDKAGSEDHSPKEGSDPREGEQDNP